MSNTNTEALRQIVESFRKQCINKTGGIGFEETISQLESRIATVEAEADTRGGLKVLDEIDQIIDDKDLPANRAFNRLATRTVAIRALLETSLPKRGKTE